MNDSYSYYGCGSNGEHHFVWTDGNTNSKCPEGIPCLCGMAIAHWEKCGECGGEVLKMLPNPSRQHSNKPIYN
jgi:hypothetical protein